MAATDTRLRMIDSAVTLLRERGVTGVTVDAVLAHSGAPRGSVYHHFPGGRDELLLAAAERAAGFVDHLFDRAMESGDAAAATERLIGFWKRILREGGFRGGCPAVALTVSAPVDLPAAGELARATFAGWRRRLAAALRSGGLGRAEADARATLVIAAVEGAIVLARAQGSVRPLDQVLTQLRPLVAPAAR